MLNLTTGPVHNQFKEMGFEFNQDLGFLYTEDDYQYIIMNSADSIWLLSDSQNKSIATQLANALNETGEATT